MSPGTVDDILARYRHHWYTSVFIKEALASARTGGSVHYTTCVTSTRSAITIDVLVTLAFLPAHSFSCTVMTVSFCPMMTATSQG